MSRREGTVPLKARTTGQRRRVALASAETKVLRVLKVKLMTSPPKDPCARDRSLTLNLKDVRKRRNRIQGSAKPRLVRSTKRVRSQEDGLSVGRALILKLLLNARRRKSQERRDVTL